MRILARIPSNRFPAGLLVLMFWVGIVIARYLPTPATRWASLVPLRCPLSWILHIPCPTCGLGRSLVAAALGHIHQSWHYHPFGLPLFWGSQGLLLLWVFFPSKWAKLQTLAQEVSRKHRVLLWILVFVYCIWGFFWRVPLS